MKLTRGLIICALIAAAFLLGMFACPHVEHKTDNMNIKYIEKNNELLEHQKAIHMEERKADSQKIDSLKQAVTKIQAERNRAIDKWKNKYKDVLTMVENMDCDSASKAQVSVAIQQTQLACDSALALSIAEIHEKDKIIQVQDEHISADNLIIQADSSLLANKDQEISFYKEEAKQAKKVLKWQKVKTWTIGIGAATLTGIVAYLSLIR